MGSDTMSYRYLRSALLPIMIGLTLAACEPRVKIEAPDKPIVINLNVKIEHEVRVKVEKDLDQLLKNNPGLF